MLNDIFKKNDTTKFTFANGENRPLTAREEHFLEQVQRHVKQFAKTTQGYDRKEAIDYVKLLQISGIVVDPGILQAVEQCRSMTRMGRLHNQRYLGLMAGKGEE